MFEIRSKLIGTVAVAVALCGVSVLSLSSTAAAAPLAASAAGIPGMTLATAGPSVEAAPQAEPAAPAAPLLEACDGGEVCIWNAVNYQGTRTEVNCIGGETFVGAHYSAKDRCANKAVSLVYKEPEIYREVACMNPNGDRPSPGTYNWIAVRAEGSRCP
jgi:hypothetical protein